MIRCGMIKKYIKVWYSKDSRGMVKCSMVKKGVVWESKVRCGKVR